MADTKLSALASATITDADEMYFNDGGNSRKGTVAALRTALGGVGFIPLDITSLREIASNDTQNLAAHGGILAQDSVPILERTNDATDKSLRVHWIVNGLEEVQFPPVPMPPDLDSAIDLTIHLVAESGSTDTSFTFDVQVWDSVGDTEMGGNSSAIADAITEATLTVANANVSGNPLGFLNIGLVPNAHTTDPIFLYAAWIEYTKKLPV